MQRGLLYRGTSGLRIIENASAKEESRRRKSDSGSDLISGTIVVLLALNYPRMPFYTIPLKMEVDLKKSVMQILLVQGLFRVSLNFDALRLVHGGRGGELTCVWGQ